MGRYLSSSQAAEMLGCHDRTVRRWLEQEKVAYIRRNGQRLIPIAEVERLREEMPDTPPPLSLEEKVTALEQKVHNQADIIQALVLQVKQLVDAGLASGNHPRRHTSAGQAYLSGAEKRGYPTGTLSLVEFARRHGLQREISTLKQLYWSKEIELAVYSRSGEAKRNKQKWWILPEQHQAVIRYCFSHGISCQPCNECASCEQLSA